MPVRRLALALIALVIAGCGQPGAPSTVVGAHAESVVVAHAYAAALRYYGIPAHVESVDDAVSALNSGAVDVAPGYTGALLHRFQPDAVARADEQVYRMLLAALPEGFQAGDYTISAQDKPAVAVTESTVDAWGGSELSVLLRHCGALNIGSVQGAIQEGRIPAELANCRMPAPRVFPDDAALFAALQRGEVNAAWTTTAATDVPDDVVLLADSTALIRAENLVPLYRRNELSEIKKRALNEVAGVLDTGTLADMRRQVAEGADPGAVTGVWLAENPLGH